MSTTPSKCGSEIFINSPTHAYRHHSASTLATTCRRLHHQRTVILAKSVHDRAMTGRVAALSRRCSPTQLQLKPPHIAFLGSVRRNEDATNTPYRPSSMTQSNAKSLAPVWPNVGRADESDRPEAWRMCNSERIGTKTRLPPTVLTCLGCLAYGVRITLGSGYTIHRSNLHGTSYAPYAIRLSPVMQRHCCRIGTRRG
jgi:hypothetical protein